jgi:DUF177 domain-containing protein
MRPTLVIEVSQIPAEGMQVAAHLDPGVVHVDGEESFALESGGSLSCRLDRGDDRTVHVRGEVSARLGLQCGRCLEPFVFPVAQELDLFYLPHRNDRDEEEDEVELKDHDMVVAYYRDERLDLGEMLREQFFLSLPMKRLCREDCRGLCPSCGANRNSAPCACPPEADPRLSVLGTLLGGGSS